jgi:nicotinate-nucleotide pyrophosphorylase
VPADAELSLAWFQAFHADAAEQAGRDPLRFSMMIELEGNADELEEQLRAYADAGVERVMLQHLQHEDVERVAVLGEVAARLR